MRRTGWRNLQADMRAYAKGIVAAAVVLTAMQLLFGQICPLVLVTGFPCPACGLTRAGCFLLTFQWERAWQMQPVIYPIALFFCYFMVQRYLLGRRVAGLVWMLCLLLALLLLVYGYRVTQYLIPELLQEAPPVSGQPVYYEMHNLAARVAR